MWALRLFSALFLGSQLDQAATQLNESELSNSTEAVSSEPTFFEKLDEAIFNALSDPKPDAADKIFSNIEMFHNCLSRVRRMYIEMEGEKIESLRNSVVQLYSSKGGPTFTRVPVDDPDHKRKLLYVFKWTEDDIKKLHKLLEESENIWYTVRNVVI